jgi:hypothetical protein
MLGGVDTLDDLPAGLPTRVHAFVADIRRLHAQLGRLKPVHHFETCAHPSCARRHYRGGTQDTIEIHDGGPDALALQGYWDLAGKAKTKNAYARRDFCTTNCYNHWKNRLEHLAGIPRGVFEADEDLRGDADANAGSPGAHGLLARRSRVPKALRWALRRNEDVSRFLRRTSVSHDGSPLDASIATSALGLRRERVRALNVDLGLLVASAALAESYSLSRDRVLAGGRVGWRTRTMFVAKALRSVGELYDSHHHDVDRVIGNLHLPEPFIDKVERRASTIL